MAVFGVEHIIGKLRRDISQVNVRLDKGIVDGSSSIRIKELLFELQIADGHD